MSVPFQSSRANLFRVPVRRSPTLHLVEYPRAFAGARLAAVFDAFGAVDLNVIAAGAWAADVATARLGLRGPPKWDTAAATGRRRLHFVRRPSGRGREHNEDEVCGVAAATIRTIIAPSLRTQLYGWLRRG